MIEIFLLMILAHVVDDFVLQLACLSKLKQKSWWETQDAYKSLYKNDYKMALLMHSMSWSVMILLPIIIIGNIPGMVLFSTFIVNTLIHYYIDDMKANKGKINLMVDQFVHMIQIITTWIVICQWI